MNKNKFLEINQHQMNHKNTDQQIINNIKQLLQQQPFAVLCTKGEKTPYGSFIAFSADDDLKRIIFATPNYTRKYQLLRECDRVAMVVDNRGNHQANISKIEAITITGIAHQANKQSEIKKLQQHLLNKHNYLHEMVHAESCAIFYINVSRYYYVTHIQEVYEWEPNQPI